MSAIKKQAEKVSSDCHDATGVTFDPTIIITIITTLLQLFGGCNKTQAQALKSIHSPNNLEKWVVKREIRKAAKGHSDDQDVVYAALLDHGVKVTSAELKSLWSEAGN